MGGINEYAICPIAVDNPSTAPNAIGVNSCWMITAGSITTLPMPKPNMTLPK